MSTTLYDKVVLTELDELVDPKHTMVLVIDVQNEFCSPGGHFDKKGTVLTSIRGMLPRLATFLDSARRSGVRVVYFRQTFLPGGLSDSPAQLKFRAQVSDRVDYCAEGTWEHAVAPEVEPQPPDLVFNKYRASAFIGTPLDLLLRSNNVKTVIITGLWTNGCVESTARDAQQHDYYVVVPSHCVTGSTESNSRIDVLAHRYTVVPEDQIASTWNSSSNH